MKKFYPCFFFLVLLSTKILAQIPALSWVKTFGGTGFDDARVKKYANFIYNVGYFENTMDFDPGPGIYNLTSLNTATNGRNIYIQKLDENGDFIWGRAFSNSNYEYFNSFDFDTDGNVYIMGHFMGTADFDPGPGISNLSSAGNFDLFIVKLSPQGNLIWAKNIGSAASGETLGLLTIENNALYITGTYSTAFDIDPGTNIFLLPPNNNGTPKLFLLKCDALANLVWVKTIEGSGTIGTAQINVDPTDNIYISGIFIGEIDFDPGAGIQNLFSDNAGQDIFLLKLDPSGNYLWAKTLESNNVISTQSLQVDNTGNILVAGFLSGQCDLDPGSGTFLIVSASSYDGFVVKLSPLGNFLWGGRIGGTSFDAIYDLAIDSQGNVYFAGAINNSSDVDPGPGVYTLSAIDNWPDLFIVKLSDSGRIIWAIPFNSSQDESFVNLFVENDNSLLVAGEYAAIMDFDPGPLSTATSTVGARDAFVLKLSQQAVPLTLIDFRAFKTNDGKIQLQWQTANEYNTDEFIVERSNSSLNFYEIGRVKAKIISPLMNQYSFADEIPLNGRNCYRLRMKDLDNRISFSPFRMIDMIKNSFIVIHHPDRTVIEVKGISSVNTNAILIYNQLGMILKRIDINNQGVFYKTISTAGFAPGIYKIALFNPAGKEVREFVKY